MDDAAAPERERGDPLRSAFTAEIEALVERIRELSAETRCPGYVTRRAWHTGTMTEETASDWDDRQMWGTGDLAVFLGGSEDSFTGLLLVLITKAQATPANMSRLELAFPREVTAWRTWQSMSPCPTFRELREALAELPASMLLP